MHSLGGSAFGSSFFASEQIPERKRSFSPRLFLRNWNPNHLSSSILLIAMSLKNIIGFLRILQGGKPSDVKFYWPTDQSAFEEPWRQVPGVSHLKFGGSQDPSEIQEYTKEEILKYADEDGKIIMFDAEIGLGCTRTPLSRLCKEYGLETRNNRAFQKSVMERVKDVLGGSE